MKPRSICVFLLLGLLAVTAALSAGPAASPKEGPGDAPIQLDKVTVTGARDLPPPEQWQYTQVAGFEVLSNASESSVRKLLRDFSRFREALQIVRPVAEKPLVSSSLILCGRQGRFRDFTADGQIDYSGPVSFLLRDREHAAIVINLEANLIRPALLAGQTPDTTGNVELEVDHYRQLYREYVRFLLTQVEFPPPPWLLEGITQLVMDIEFSDRSINYGKLDPTKGAITEVGGYDQSLKGGMSAGSMVAAMTGGSGRGKTSAGGGDEDDVGDADPSTVVGDRPFNVVLRHRSLLPLDKFFAVTADAPEARNPLSNSLWSKQAYAFVHMCLFRREGKFKRPFATFVQRLVNEPVSESLFQECFQLSYKEMMKELYNYIRVTDHQFRHIELTKEGRIITPDVVFRDATEGDIGRIKGEAQRLVGRRTDAQTSFYAAYARGERDPRLLAALGIEEQHAGNAKFARKLLEQAAKAGTHRPSAYVALARLRLHDAGANPAGGAGRLSEAQLLAVLEPLYKARTLKPALSETYEVMAETWARSSILPRPDDVRVIGEGVMQFPFNSDLTLQAARLYATAGDRVNAIAIARLGIRFAANDATKRRFEEYLATLAPDAAAR